MIDLSALRRMRWAVRGVMTLAIMVSLVANVLHAPDNLISRTIAAWPPVALLLTVELISRIPVTSRALSFVRIAATVLISCISAWLSYWHMVGVAVRYGETGHGSQHLIPLTVDGLMIVASVCLVQLAQMLKPAPTEPGMTEAVIASLDWPPPPPETPPAPETPALTPEDREALKILGDLDITPEALENIAFYFKPEGAPA